MALDVDFIAFGGVMITVQATFGTVCSFLSVSIVKK